jgi:hypothetical protein
MFPVRYELNCYILFRRNKRLSRLYGGGVEYLHRSPASRRRRRKWNPVAGGITGPPSFGGLLIQGPGPPGSRSLEPETVKYDHESHGTRTRE